MVFNCFQFRGRHCDRFLQILGQGPPQGAHSKDGFWRFHGFRRGCVMVFHCFPLFYMVFKLRGMPGDIAQDSRILADFESPRVPTFALGFVKHCLVCNRGFLKGGVMVCNGFQLWVRHCDRFLQILGQGQPQGAHSKDGFGRFHGFHKGGVMVFICFQLFSIVFIVFKLRVRP